MSRRPYHLVSVPGERLLPRADKLLCAACGERLPLDAFRVTNTGSRSSWCRPCSVAATRAWRARERDAINARRRERYAARREAINADRRAAYAAAHPSDPGSRP